MRYSNDTRNLGDKLLPKLIAAVTQSVIATKRGLMPTEHKLRVMAMQDIIDRMGIEAAELGGPIIQAALDYHGDSLHPLVRDYLESVASGKDQIKALGGVFFGGASSTLNTVISNSLAPLAYQLIEHMPSLTLDPQTAAAGWATGQISSADALLSAARAGFPAGEGLLLQGLAQTIPPISDLNEMVWRGFLSQHDANTWVKRSGVPDAFVRLYEDSRHNILTIADAALGVLKGSISEAEGKRIAEQNGYSNADFDTFLLNTGEPLGLQELQSALRRGFIDTARFSRGVRQSRTRNEWNDIALALRFAPPSTADAIEASIQGYMTKEQARKYAEQNGLEASAFDPLWLTAGEPLSRTEMTDLVNRGEATLEQYRKALAQSRLKDSYIELSTKLIKRPMSVADAVEGNVQGYLTVAQSDAIMSENGLRDQDRIILRDIAGEPLSKTEMLRLHRMGKVTVDEVKQALRESRLKNKYIDHALELTEVIPPIFEIRILLQQGAITDAQATTLIHELGYPQWLIAPIVKAFSSGGATAHKTITEGMLADLYLEQAINGTEFRDALKALGYSTGNIELIVEVNDWKAELAARNALISKVRSQYVGRKINEATAQADLLAAFIPSTVVDKIMGDMNLEIAAQVRLLSEAQIATAWQLGLFDQIGTAANTDAATAYLERLGYTAPDARILLEIKNKGPLTVG